MNNLVPDENYNCSALFDDGSEIPVYANQLHNKDLDKWSGWACMAGMTRLYIDNTGNVWSCEARNQHLGYIGQSWNVLHEPSTCRQENCGPCTDDLATEKYER